MAEDYILETRNLVKEFKGFVAVNDVSLKVRRGHIHALIGPNGAGKTTVFNLLTKFLGPPRGSIHFNGKDITPEQMELSRLRAENIKLKRENEILKKATAYFARDAL